MCMSWRTLVGTAMVTSPGGPGFPGTSCSVVPCCARCQLFDDLGRHGAKASSRSQGVRRALQDLVEHGCALTGDAKPSSDGIRSFRCIYRCVALGTPGGGATLHCGCRPALTTALLRAVFVAFRCGGGDCRLSHRRRDDTWAVRERRWLRPSCRNCRASFNSTCSAA